MGLKRKPACTCGICPACVRTTYARQAKPYTDPAWTGRHPLHPAARTTV
ncbi:hypothetical protein [Rugosimonospora africana]|uniref:Uncharacterized protein n=1 Tax=Rugosimonospora africana TaxID=556532 RepID=A0A8J3R1R1_9ACTN|nr:hypothetical protein [Rugosimonospora africana]GIH21484.1 hypothetical protein Raf01_96560 [Rugosimonospora africana]